MISKLHSQELLDSDELVLVGSSLPSRKEFLIPASNPCAKRSSKQILCRAKDCTIDRLPAVYGMLARVVPSILHMIELHLIADELRSTVLQPLKIKSLTNISTAICASSAQALGNYQRLEFLGDCVLKLYTTLHLMNEHPTWPESYLTKKKSVLVSNQMLAKRSLINGLDKFIVSQRFSGKKWKPQYNSKLMDASEGSRRSMSRKVLADVVEALIGAAYLEDAERVQPKDPNGEADGLPWIDISTAAMVKASSCITLLVPSLAGTFSASLEGLRGMEMHPPRISGASATTIKKLLGADYSPDLSLMLCALTDPSYADPVADTYDRLEFLGDAVLDHVVVSYLWAHEPPLSHQDMHTLRTVLVNREFLSFLSLEWVTEDELFDIEEEGQREGPPSFVTVRTSRKHPLWHHMRHGSSELVEAGREAERNHEKVRKSILDAFESGNTYPWPLLLRARAPKFLSDLIESVLGAVFIDTDGDFRACMRVMQRAGLFRYLERWMDFRNPSAPIRLVHPKEDLGMLAGGEKVRYEITGGVGARQTARVYVGERQVGVAEGDIGASKVEMETLVAEVGVIALSGEPRTM